MLWLQKQLNALSYIWNVTFSREDKKHYAAIRSFFMANKMCSSFIYVAYRSKLLIVYNGNNDNSQLFWLNVWFLARKYIFIIKYSQISFGFGGSE